ncbi:MAG: hypothetical protein HN457_02350 [Opitutales bacterium]|jgi:hypothetical protein|nr:hypothetical protein [Opitutales bacterium]MBT5169001.1 hypothetical protein [Opitutales bacterium]MBT5813565.1 hypothetical protein [Opitutales bacterium]MDG2256314.1 hypothetical protein [Opitutaceae bacterium]
MMNVFFRSLLAIAVCVSTLSLFGARPEVLQVLSGLDRPVAATFGPNAETIFVANRSRGSIGALRGMGSITKFDRGSDGAYKLASKRFAIGFTAPSAMALLPVSLAEDLPKGLLILVSGTPLIENEDGRLTKDASKDFIGLTVIDPMTGKILRKVDLGPAAAMKLAGEYSLISPNSLDFDDKGNLYIADTGIGGNMFMFKNRVKAQPTIYRIDRVSLGKMFNGEAPASTQVMKVSSIPGDMRYHSADDSIYFLANHIQGATKGAVFKVASSDFQNQSAIQTIVRELTALSSLAILPNGKTLLAANSGELQVPRGKKNSREIRFKPEMRFSTPGRFDMITQADGNSLLAVPEETGDAGAGKGQRLKIVLFPAKY